MRCGQRLGWKGNSPSGAFFSSVHGTDVTLKMEASQGEEVVRMCASRHPVHVYIVYISSRRPCPSGLGPFPRPTKTHGTSIESRAAGAGYKGTAARLGPPLNTPSARSLAPRHENSCVFPLPSSLVRPLRQSGVRYGVGRRRCQKKLKRAESGGFMRSREALWVVHHSHSFSFSSSGERTGTGDTSAPPAWRKVGKDERHLNPV